VKSCHENRLRKPAKAVDGDLTEQIGKQVRQPATFFVADINHRALQYLDIMFISQRLEIIDCTQVHDTNRHLSSLEQRLSFTVSSNQTNTPPIAPSRCASVNTRPPAISSDPGKAPLKNSQVSFASNTVTST
jgi:hypothetical protein